MGDEQALAIGIKLKASEVATALGWHVNSVGRLQSRYLREGEAARPNEVLEAQAVQEAYEKAVGHPVGRSTIYKMLTRNGWRRVVTGRVVPARTWAPSRFSGDEVGPESQGRKPDVP